jgi:hypothetical protein
MKNLPDIYNYINMSTLLRERMRTNTFAELETSPRAFVFCCCLPCSSSVLTRPCPPSSSLWTHTSIREYLLCAPRTAAEGRTGRG